MMCHTQTWQSLACVPPLDARGAMLLAAEVMILEGMGLGALSEMMAKGRRQ
jgi:hypothetical protein